MASIITKLFELDNFKGLKNFSFLWSFLIITAFHPNVAEAQYVPDGDNRLFVDQNISGGTGSGISWDNAIPELRDVSRWAQMSGTGQIRRCKSGWPRVLICRPMSQ